MNRSKLFWFAVSLLLCNHEIFAARYHSNQLAKFEEDIEKEKRSFALIGLGLIAVSVDVYQKADKCKSESPNLSYYVKQFDKTLTEYQDLRDQINLDWNGVENVRGFVARIGASLTILTSQMEDFFSAQYDIFSALDPDFTTKVDAAQAALKKKYEAATSIPFDEFVLGYQKATGFSMKLLTTTAELTGTSIHLFTHQVTHAIKVQTKPILAGGRARIAVGTFSTTKVNNLLGASNALRRQNFVATKLSVTSFVGSAVTGVLVLATAANVIWQIWSYKEKCAKYLKKAKEAYAKIKSAVEKLKKIRIDVAKLKQNGTDTYNLYIPVLSSVTMLNTIDTLIDYAKGSSLEATLKTKVGSILSSYKNISSKSLTMGDREILLRDMTSIVMPNILANARCVNEKLKIVAFMRGRCGMGLNTLDDLYNTSKTSYESSRYKCNVKEPLVKATVIKAVQDNLALFNQSSDCILNNDNLVSDVCANQGLSNNEIAGLLKQSISVVSKIIATCGQVSVPQHSGPIRICAKKQEGIPSAQVTAVFNYWKPAEVLSIYAACALTAAQKEIICLIRGKGVEAVQQKYSNYNPATVQTALEACSKVMSPTDRFIICSLKQAVSLTIINTDANFAELRNRYNGTNEVAATYNSCP